MHWKWYEEERSGRKLDNIWGKVIPISGKRYVVQTSDRVVERCLLMTTDPGDLVLDPTCGSGATADVAETWGRRWITCDVQRVAIAVRAISPDRESVPMAQHHRRGHRPLRRIQGKDHSKGDRCDARLQHRRRARESDTARGPHRDRQAQSSRMLSVHGPSRSRHTPTCR